MRAGALEPARLEGRHEKWLSTVSLSCRQREVEDLEGRTDEYRLHKVEADCLEAGARELAETLRRWEHTDDKDPPSSIRKWNKR